MKKIRLVNKMKCSNTGCDKTVKIDNPKEQLFMVAIAGRGLFYYCSEFCLQDHISEMYEDVRW